SDFSLTFAWWGYGGRRAGIARRAVAHCQANYLGDLRSRRAVAGPERVVSVAGDCLVAHSRLYERVERVGPGYVREARGLRVSQRPSVLKHRRVHHYLR